LHSFNTQPKGLHKGKKKILIIQNHYFIYSLYVFICIYLLKVWRKWQALDCCICAVCSDCSCSEFES
jgi:uncharacterized membrane protein YfhO